MVSKTKSCLRTYSYPNQYQKNVKSSSNIPEWYPKMVKLKHQILCKLKHQFFSLHSSKLKPHTVAKQGKPCRNLYRLCRWTCINVDRFYDMSWLLLMGPTTEPIQLMRTTIIKHFGMTWMESFLTLWPCYTTSGDNLSSKNISNISNNALTV